MSHPAGFFSFCLCGFSSRLSLAARGFKEKNQKKDKHYDLKRSTDSNTRMLKPNYFGAINFHHLLDTFDS